MTEWPPNFQVIFSSKRSQPTGRKPIVVVAHVHLPDVAAVAMNRASQDEALGVELWPVGNVNPDAHADLEFFGHCSLPDRMAPPDLFT